MKRISVLKQVLIILFSPIIAVIMILVFNYLFKWVFGWILLKIVWFNNLSGIGKFFYLSAGGGFCLFFLWVCVFGGFVLICSVGERYATPYPYLAKYRKIMFGILMISDLSWMIWMILPNWKLFVNWHFWGILGFSIVLVPVIVGYITAYRLLYIKKD